MVHMRQRKGGGSVVQRQVTKRRRRGSDGRAQYRHAEARVCTCTLEPKPSLPTQTSQEDVKARPALTSTDAKANEQCRTHAQHMHARTHTEKAHAGAVPYHTGGDTSTDAHVS
jgi:hypothetical protein